MMKNDVRKIIGLINPLNMGIVVCAVMGILISDVASGASVVSRPGASPAPAARRANYADSRMPTLSVSLGGTTSTTTTTSGNDNTTTTTTTSDTINDDIDEDEEDSIIEYKSDQFDEILSDFSSSKRDSGENTELADEIRRQRAALDAADNAANAEANAAAASGRNACDTLLRKCMAEKCGKDFTGCRGDTDMTWGDKMDTCRRTTKCTGHEYALFTAEIKADRDLNAQLANFNQIIECGNTYNDCIMDECGETYGKCLGKKTGDAAIAKCATIAKNCTQYDNGLASRTMNVFGTLRQDAEVQIKKDEERLYKMRDEMESVCRRLGAMFDQRSLDCVFTVNFFANNQSTPYASKKAYAGSTFDCTQNWFGVDITTFKENAYRYTRAQTSATSAFMGAGLGVGVGAITSGAIDRAIDRHKAEKALKKAEKEHESNYGKNGQNQNGEEQNGEDQNGENGEEGQDQNGEDQNGENNEQGSDQNDTDTPGGDAGDAGGDGGGGNAGGDGGSGGE